MFIITALYLSTSKRDWLSHVKKMPLKVKSKFALQVCGRTREKGCSLQSPTPAVSHTTQHDAFVTLVSQSPIILTYTTNFPFLLPGLITPHKTILTSSIRKQILSMFYKLASPAVQTLFIGPFSQAVLHSFSLHSIKLLALSIPYLKLRLQSNCS